MDEQYFRDFDCTLSIRDYDFTRRAIREMNHILDSENFQDMSAEEIFHYLSEKMAIIFFSDYLKRYIYELAEIEAPFREVSEAVYIDIIKNAFWENRMTFSFESTRAKPTAIIKRWLKQAAAARKTVFLLGFGLRMSDTDVDDFLQKVLMEETFDFENYKECIFWHCFHNDLPYSRAQEYIQQYERLPETGNAREHLWEFMRSNPKMYLSDEEQMILYLEQLKLHTRDNNKVSVANSEFLRLYQDSCRICREILYDGKQGTITPADMEKVLCSGIPVTRSGNMMKMSASILRRQFTQKRMTRQRLASILAGKTAVERFDLITLLFLRYAEEVEPDCPAKRYKQFIDEMNGILKTCGMRGLYPVNPYESFVLMCLLTDYPLETYTEVWEQSFDIKA